MINDIARTYSYDMENRVAGDGANTYSYDASNLRILDGTKYHFWSSDGRIIGPYTFGPVFGQFGWELRFSRQQERAYLDGQLVATTDRTPTQVLWPF